MRVFLTGANGWVGSAILAQLLEAGHSVAGLVRTADKAAALAAAGATPVLGSLSDLALLRRAADDADGVIHTAFGLDFADMPRLAEEDRQAILTFGEVYAGSDRVILATGGFGLLPAGQVFTEDARPPMVAGFPRASEQTIFAIAQQGLRASVVRLPRSVHGRGERHGFIPMLLAVARAKGCSAYIGDGDNLWPSVHRLDAARLFCQALERDAGNQAYHAVAEAGIPFRSIAEAIGRTAGVPIKSVRAEEASAHFGALAMWVAGNGPADSEHTSRLLNWQPRQPELLEDIDAGAYCAV